MIHFKKTITSFKAELKMNALTAASRAFRPILAPARAQLLRAQVPMVRNFSESADKEVVEPELFNSLEWTLSAPAPFHQFDESPIIVEIEHLD
mmetsp:Transcript_21157/g.27457  ORF Transcript_21157/g.27457 Transcript_21157/m.27457 type:complete len:93 (+) Transcript_21157:3-281(+)